MPSLDENGLKLERGDLVVVANPFDSPTESLAVAGMVFCVVDGLCSVNVPSAFQPSMALALFNIPCAKVRKIYSSVRGNMRIGS